MPLTSVILYCFTADNWELPNKPMHFRCNSESLAKVFDAKARRAKRI